MRYLIISDVHLGDPRFRNADALLEFLEQSIFDALILNGDFADFWASSSRKIR